MHAVDHAEKNGCMVAAGRQTGKQTGMMEAVSQINARMVALLLAKPGLHCQALHFSSATRTDANRTGASCSALGFSTLVKRRLSEMMSTAGGLKLPPLRCFCMVPLAECTDQSTQCPGHATDERGVIAM